jgi:hypothetical protein
MNQTAAARPVSSRTLVSWRRVEPGDSLLPRQLLTIVLLVSLAAVIVQLVLWFVNATDYVGVDPDDSMRLVEVRDYLAGQSWFDLDQYRLGPDGGTLMHWSRLIDWPIAQLINFYGLFLDPQQAEAAAVVTWPLLLILPLLAAASLASYRLGGKSGMVIGLILSLVFLVAIVRFRPGAIDHHNVQLILVTFIAAMLIDPLARASNFAAAAIAGALALAIGAETTPHVAVAAMSVALLWALNGERYRRAAIGFGVAFALATGILFFATTPARLWASVTCDTLSLGYLVLASAGGAMLAGSAVALTRRTPTVRLASLAATGVVVLLLAVSIAPECLQNPLNSLDPLLKTYWLSSIGEAQSIMAVMDADPTNIGTFYAVGIIGLAVCVMRILRGEQVIPHAVLLGLIATSWAVSAVQVRGMLFANFLAFIPLSALVADLRSLYLERRNDVRAVTAFVLSALFSVPSVWTVVGVLAADPMNALAGATTNVANDTKNESAAMVCVTAESGARLATLPPGRLLTSFNEGPALLRYTPHSVLGANYHRNQRGMVASIEIGMAKPDTAFTKLAEQNVRYVLLCDDDPMAERIAKEYPSGLYAALSKNEVPGFLEELPMDKVSGLRIFEMIQR